MESQPLPSLGSILTDWVEIRDVIFKLLVRYMKAVFGRDNFWTEVASEASSGLSGWFCC